METKSKIKKSSLPELCSMHYNFIIFNFECTLFLSKFFKNKDHKVTVPKLYELPVFLRLIYDSLQRVKIITSQNQNNFPFHRLPMPTIFTGAIKERMAMK